jgi:hypothetical protein
MMNEEPGEWEERAGLRRKWAVAYLWFSWNAKKRRFKSVKRSPARPAVGRKTFQHS